MSVELGRRQIAAEAAGGAAATEQVTEARPVTGQASAKGDAAAEVEDVAEQARATLAAQAHNQEALQTQQRHAVIAALLKPQKMNQALQRLAGQKRRGILVIEDDPSTGLLLTTLLGDMAKTTLAENAYNAARAYEIHLPALVFLDLGLPDMDGLALLKLIKAADADARVVILTANATRENLQAATQCGASGFLAKPFTRAKLQEALQKFGLVK